MSEYFRILNRVENEEPDKDLDTAGKPVAKAKQSVQQKRPAPATNARQPADPATRQQPSPVAETRPRAPQTPAPVARTSDGRDAFVAIFDNLRASAHEHKLTSVVVAPVSASTAIVEVSKGLGSEAYRHNLQVAVAELTEDSGEVALKERARLVTQANAGRADERSISSVSFSLAGGPAPAELENWLAACASDNDLIIVEGPALETSIDSALVAKACDGLVLVVEPNVTTYEDLTAAVTKSKQAGCKVLGLVMNGTEELPTWVRHILS